MEFQNIVNWNGEEKARFLFERNTIDIEGQKEIYDFSKVEDLED